MNAHDRIETPCPSCGARALFIGTGGHLTCGVLGCKKPTVESAVFDLRAQLAEAEDLARLILHCLTRDTPLEAVGAIIREAKARLEPDGRPSPPTESPAEARLRKMAPHCRGCVWWNEAEKGGG